MTTVTFPYKTLNRTKEQLKARKALDKKQKVVIVVTGFEAFLLSGALQPFLPNAKAKGGQLVPANASNGAALTAASTARSSEPSGAGQSFTGVEVAIAIAIVVGAVAAIGLATVAAICTYGMDRGYKMDIKHRVSAKGDHQLDLILVPPK